MRHGCVCSCAGGVGVYVGAFGTFTSRKVHFNGDGAMPELIGTVRMWSKRTHCAHKWVHAVHPF